MTNGAERDPSRALRLREHPIYFRASDETLFGILNHPEASPNGIGVVLAQGGNLHLVCCQRNRFGTRLARSLARDGFHVLRFDYHGVGESTGTGRFDVNRPRVDDLRAALGQMRLHTDRLVIVGTCFGARTAVAVMPEVEDVVAFVLVGMALVDDPRSEQLSRVGLATMASALLDPAKLRNLLDRRRRRLYLEMLSSRLKRSLGVRSRQQDHVPRKDSILNLIAGAVDSGVRVLLLSGNEIASYVDQRRALERRLEALVAGAPGNLDIRHDPRGDYHVFSTLEAQRHCLETIQSWLERRVPGTPASGSPRS